MLASRGLHVRAALFRLIRSFFFEQSFLEVDTPVRQPVLIPEANIVPLRSEDWYLQTSPEQCMKRLLARGCAQIFQLCPCFRAGEKGRLHVEEFTLLEWYRKDADYRVLMDDCEALLRFVAEGVEAELQRQGLESDGLAACRQERLQGGWQRLSVKEAFVRYSPVSLQQAMLQDLFEEMLVEYIEPQLGLNVPTFLYDYPAQMASLARLNRSHPDVAERFELYVDGVELANGFSELTDAREQRRRFDDELAQMATSPHGQTVLPEHFLHDLDQLDEAAGIALGVDRLLLVLLGKDHIAEVLPFAPHELG